MPPASLHMVCFTFYIFNRKGVCQYYHEWSRSKPSREGGSKQEDFKLMFGLFWSMKTFSAAMDPKGCVSVDQSKKMVPLCL